MLKSILLGSWVVALSLTAFPYYFLFFLCFVIHSVSICRDWNVVSVRVPSHWRDCYVTSPPRCLYCLGCPSIWWSLLLPDDRKYPHLLIAADEFQSLSHYETTSLHLKLVKWNSKPNVKNHFSSSSYRRSFFSNGQYLYLLNWLLTVPAELSASSLIVSFWVPEGSSFPVWVVPVIVIVVLVIINMLGVVRAWVEWNWNWQCHSHSNS